MAERENDKQQPGCIQEPGCSIRKTNEVGSFKMALVRASHRFARISATKVRPFADLIRGKSVAEGLDDLKYLPNRGARVLEKVLKSAMANAEEKGARNVEDLTIAEARADGGPMMKRIRPRARGMAFLIRKRFSHVHVAVDAPDVR